MSFRSTLHLLLRNPAVIAAELAWRWTYGAAALALAIVAVIRLERAIVVSPQEQRMVFSRSPILIAQAILEIADRVRPFAVHLALIVIPLILLVWLFAATVGHGYVLRRMGSSQTARPHWLALLLLNLLRIVSLALLVLAYFGCSSATTLVSNPAAPNYALALLSFVCLFAVALALWSFLQWILTTACIYAGREGLGLPASLSATMRLLRGSRRELFSISAQNSWVRTVAALIFTFLGLLPLAIYSVPTVFWTVEIGLFLAYCTISDVLLLARVAAYIEVMERVQQDAVAEHA